jgi:hypothetical protein
VEAKCLLWPDGSLECANYQDKIEKAAKQILRKKDAVNRNYACFAKRLKQLGYVAPEKPRVICCVLTNSVMFSGFPIEGVPVVDLSILGSFFVNEHVKFEGRQAGKIIEQRVMRFFESKADAGEVLEGHLLDPPQLSDVKRSVKSREVVFPVESPLFGKIIQETFRVEIDMKEMSVRYNLPNIGVERDTPQAAHPHLEC